LATSQQAGDEWSIFYSGRTDTAGTYDYMNAYFDGWVAQPKVYSRNNAWVSPPTGTGWITTTSSGAMDAPVGLYAYQIGVGAYDARETWAFFGSFAIDDGFVGAFLVGKDNSYMLITGMPSVVTWTSLSHLPTEGIGITDLVEGMTYDLVMFTMNAAGPQGFYSNLELVKVAPSPAPIPEPATLAIVGLGLAGLGYARRRQQRRATAA